MTQLPPGTTSEAVADGYYVMIKPLCVGNHTIAFHAELPAYDFSIDVTYQIKVVPPSRMNSGLIPPNWEYPGLVVKWWQWVFAQPVATNPLIDTTGANALYGQPTTGNTWFLGSQWSQSTVYAVVRDVTVPSGKRLFFPLVNSWCDVIGMPEETTIDELRALAAFWVENPTLLWATVDGRALQGLDRFRVQSPVFTYTIPENDPTADPPVYNALWYLFGGALIPGDYGWTSTDVYPAVADGYYLMLAPLPPGEHLVAFGAYVPCSPPAIQDVIYRITVLPRGK